MKKITGCHSNSRNTNSNRVIHIDNNERMCRDSEQRYWASNTAGIRQHSEQTYSNRVWRSKRETKQQQQIPSSHHNPLDCTCTEENSWFLQVFRCSRFKRWGTQHIWNEVHKHRICVFFRKSIYIVAGAALSNLKSNTWELSTRQSRQRLRRSQGEVAWRF